MSELKPLCAGTVYRGVIIVTILAEAAPRCVVIGTAHRQVVKLYECASMSEAVALIDAGLALNSVTTQPVLENGGARAVEFGAGSITAG